MGAKRRRRIENTAGHRKVLDEGTQRGSLVECQESVNVGGHMREVECCQAWLLRGRWCSHRQALVQRRPYRGVLIRVIFEYALGACLTMRL